MKKILFLLCLLNFTACGSISTEDTEKLKITTSFYPLYFFANQIVGEEAIVTNITPASSEPHDYELTPADLQTIQESQLLVVNGLVEPWLTDVEEDLLNKGIHILNVTQGMELLSELNDATLKDPHVWLDLTWAQKIVNAMSAQVKALDPEKATFYAENTEKLLSRLAQLDAAYKEGLASCERHTFITSHAAFAYLARAYGLSQMPISGLSPDAEPSAEEMGKIVDFAKANNVDIIFFETLVSPRLAQTIADEVGAQALVLNPIEGLSREQLALGEDYFTEMESNLENLRKALHCE